MTERAAYDIPWTPDEMANLLDALAQSADRAMLSYSETAHIARNAAKTIRWLMAATDDKPMKP
jgi:hypothetical protein